MAEIREDIYAFLANALTVGLPDVLVERNRTVEVEVFPSINMLDAGHTVETDNHGVDDVLQLVELELYADASTSAELGAALNTLYGRTVQIVLADRSVNGLANDIEETTFDDLDVVRAEGQSPAMGGILSLLVRYQRELGDPYTVAP